jgi:uncharacterized membrane protein
MQKTTRTVAALSSLLVAGVTLASVAQAADAPAAAAAATEKCYGVAKAGKNDCASAGHACAGQSKAASGKEWVKVPVGTCERLVGGSLTAAK